MAGTVCIMPFEEDGGDGRWRIWDIVRGRKMAMIRENKQRGIGLRIIMNKIKPYKKWTLVVDKVTYI